MCLARIGIWGRLRRRVPISLHAWFLVRSKNVDLGTGYWDSYAVWKIWKLYLVYSNLNQEGCRWSVWRGDGEREGETELCDGLHVDFLVNGERNSKDIEPVQPNSATDPIMYFVKTTSSALIVQLTNSDKHPEWEREATF